MSISELKRLRELTTQIEHKKEELKHVAQKKREGKGKIEVDEELMILSRELDQLIVEYMKGSIHKDSTA